MISSRINLTVVGFFVLATLATLVVVLALLSGRTGAADRYYTEYRNVAGLKFGSQVLYEGFPVGQVEEIQPIEREGRMGFRVEMSIRENWRIPEDSVARSEASGLLAPQTVSISAGHSDKILAPGAMIRPGEAGGLLASFSGLAGSFDEFTDQALVPLVDNLNRQVTSFGMIMEHDLKPMAANANRVMAHAAQHLPSILQRVDQAAGDLSAVSRRLDAVMSTEGVAAIDRMLLNADAATASLKRSSVELEQLLQSAAPDLQVGAQEFRLTMEGLSRHAEPFAQNLDVTSRNLQEFSRLLRQNPGLLLRDSERPDDTVPPLRPRER